MLGDSYMRVLSTTAALQREVVKLMKPGTKRIAIVAFVGAGADAYIPKPEGVRIVCWPKAGGTNPAAVRKLLLRKADVRFADRLHMKLYWAKGRGAIVGSANLTTNALGSGGLRELAVFVPDNTIPIAAIMRSLAARPVSEKELDALELEHRKLGRKIAGPEVRTSYLDWYASPSRSRWKLGWWTKDVAFSSQAKAKAKGEYNRRPRFSMWGRPREHREADWVLTFRVNDRRVFSARWLYVDFVVRGGGKGDEYPFEAVQVKTAKECTAPPFSINPTFLRAFRKACQDFGIPKIKKLKSVTPPEELLRAIAKSVRALS